MRSRSAQVLLALVCFVLGILLVVQFRTQTRLSRQVASLPISEQMQIINNLSQANDQLRAEVAGLQLQLSEYEQTVGKSELDRMVQDINMLRVINGSSEVSGAGVELTIGGTIGPRGRLRAEEMHDLINELRDAGAEAIAINNIRLVVNSSFTNSSDGIIVNGDRLLVPPYVIQAIGEPQGLETALKRPGGLITPLTEFYPGVQITIFRKTKIVLPKAEHVIDLKVARVPE